MAVQLLLCGVLPPELVQNCSQHSEIIHFHKLKMIAYHPQSRSLSVRDH